MRALFYAASQSNAGFNPSSYIAHHGDFALRLIGAVFPASSPPSEKDVSQKRVEKKVAQVEG